ncbi:MAG: acyl-CoA dehydrogenase family protein [Chloroflexota bacterium]
MNFGLTSSQQAHKKAATTFAQEHLQQELDSLDHEQAFNWAGWRACAEQGYMGLTVPTEYGGGGLDILDAVLAMEGLGVGCRDNGLIFALNAHLWACAMPVVTFGTEEQKSHYLPKLASGEWIAAHAVSEPNAGSDAYSMKTTAEQHGDTIVLNGHKIYTTNGPIADLVLVFAQETDSEGEQVVSAFLVEKDTSGFSVKRTVSKMGMRTAQMGELLFEECVIPAANRLGVEGGGMAIFTHGMEWERAFILSHAVGSMEYLLKRTVRFARQRKQFGQPIGKFQQVADKLVSMQIRLEHARNLLYKTAWLKSQNKSILMEAAMTKVCLSEAWVATCEDAMQVHGTLGYLTETGLERELRDALASRFYSGTNEIQKNIIAGMMGL